MKTQAPKKQIIFENRKPPSNYFAFELGAGSAGLLLIMLIALVLITALVFIFSKMPGRTLFFFIVGPFLNIYNFGNMLNSAVPLMLGALGVSVAMKTGSLNLGGEGQIYSGAFIATIAALALEPLGIFGGVVAIIAGACVAGVLAAFSGFLKAQWNTNDLITTFLVSSAVVLIVNYLVNGPFLDPSTNLQATRKIAEVMRLPRILPPSNLNTALFIALAAAAVMHIFLYRTKVGYEFRMIGTNEIFARYGGINTKANIVLAMLISGALYGLAGGLAVFGTYYATVKEFSAGLGWNGLAVALIARFNPLAAIPASLFFAWIGSGARIAMQNSDVSAELASIVQAVIFLLATSMALKNIKPFNNIVGISRIGIFRKKQQDEQLQTGEAAK